MVLTVFPVKIVKISLFFYCYSYFIGFHDTLSNMQEYAKLVKIVLFGQFFAWTPKRLSDNFYAALRPFS